MFGSEVLVHVLGEIHPFSEALATVKGTTFVGRNLYQT